MLPLTVSSASLRPPLPIVPRKLRGPRRPVTMIGKSVWMSPFTVVARTSVDRPAEENEGEPPFMARGPAAFAPLAAAGGRPDPPVVLWGPAASGRGIAM